MTEITALDSRTTAVLAMDFQRAIVEGYVADQAALLGRTAKLLAAARGAGVRVIHVVVGFRPGYPEVSDRNLAFSGVKATGRFAADDPAAAIHPDLALQPDEVVVTKHRVGAFAGTDLEMVLRANGIETLVLAGIATSGVVLSTLRHAADADYRLFVAADCCADRDDEVHRVLLDKVFPRQAHVRPADEIAALFI
jgi:nicotinamidase-related amidase